MFQPLHLQFEKASVVYYNDFRDFNIFYAYIVLPKVKPEFNSFLLSITMYYHNINF